MIIFSASLVLYSGLYSATSQTPSHEPSYNKEKGGEEMTITGITLAESKKAVEPEPFKGEVLASTTKRSKFYLVVSGVRSHDSGKLGDGSQRNARN